MKIAKLYLNFDQIRIFYTNRLWFECAYLEIGYGFFQYSSFTHFTLDEAGVYSPVDYDLTRYNIHYGET